MSIKTNEYVIERENNKTFDIFEFLVNFVYSVFCCFTIMWRDQNISLKLFKPL